MAIGGKPAPIIRKALNTERKSEVWELKVRQGMSVKGISELLGVSTSNVYTLLNSVIREAEATLDKDVFRWKLEQHYKYDHIYEQSMAAWESSKRALRRDKIKREPKPGQLPGEATPTEVVTVTEEQAGDSRFLNAATAALQAQAKLWGFNAPDMVETTNRNLTLTATVDAHDAIGAVEAAERAFRESKYGRREQAALPVQSGVVVSAVREDFPPNKG